MPRPDPDAKHEIDVPALRDFWAAWKPAKGPKDRGLDDALRAAADGLGRPDAFAQGKFLLGATTWFSRLDPDRPPHRPAWVLETFFSCFAPSRVNIPSRSRTWSIGRWPSRFGKVYGVTELRFRGERETTLQITHASADSRPLAPPIAKIETDSIACAVSASALVSSWARKVAPAASRPARRSETGSGPE